MAAWRPLTANATSYGLIMLVVYVTAAWWCSRAAERCRDDPSYGIMTATQREHRLWQAIAGLLAVLAIYRQLDVAELLTGLGRELAVHGDWYGHRRPFQSAMVWTLAVTILAVATALFRSVWPINLPAATALAASTLLVLLLSINVLSLHPIDRFLHAGYRRVTIYNLVEAGSLAAILAVSRLRGLQMRAGDRG